MYLVIKRFFDIIASLLALIVLSPILVPIVILLKLTDEGEVFYFQKRVGFKNKIFKIFKFATMLKNSPNMGTGAITLRNDPRVTKVGKFLRMSKINELPQIINVLKGDMSVVGPRPLMEVSMDNYPQNIKERIYDVRPGITGIGSLIFRDEEKIVSEAENAQEMYKKIFPYKGELEMWYQKNISFFTDLKIIILTAWSVIFKENQLAFKWFKDLPKRSF